MLSQPPPVPPVPLPVINVPAPVVNNVAPEGMPGWVGPVIAFVGGLLGVFVGSALSRSREHHKWLYERRYDLYSELLDKLIAPELLAMRDGRIPNDLFENRLPRKQVVREMRIFDGLRAKARFHAYGFESMMALTEWLERDAENDPAKARDLVARTWESAVELRDALEEGLLRGPVFLDLRSWGNDRATYSRRKARKVRRTRPAQLEAPSEI